MPALPALPDRSAAPASGRRLLPEIGPRCTGCGRCVGACPTQVLWLQAQGWTKTAWLHDAAGCTGCRRCAVVCPFDAIRMQATAAPAAGG